MGTPSSHSAGAGPGAVVSARAVHGRSNALRKIAALQAKPQPRSRASSTRSSALASPRVSSEGDTTADAALSHNASPGGYEAVQRTFVQVLAMSHLNAACPMMSDKLVVPVHATCQT